MLMRKLNPEIVLYSFFFKVLFIQERETEQAGRWQRERPPNAELDPRTLVRPEPKLKPLGY